MEHDPLDRQLTARMRDAGVPASTIRAFLQAVHRLKSGATGLMAESALEPVASLPRLEECPAAAGSDVGLLKELALVKLNGGLGTSMGLARAKSLIAAKGNDTFLDFIARQILQLRRSNNLREPVFFLMNSFATRQDTLEYLGKYPELAAADGIDFLQNKVPKIDPLTFEPVSWAADPSLEWCPPGHGDIYPAMRDSGLLDRLLGRGVKYLFVSNSDNLGATVDLRLLRYFAGSGLAFLMEVAERTPADRKGGHLACRRSDGRFVLRESAQTSKADEPSFQDIHRHRFFNTNNLWIQLEELKSELDRHDGAIPLPLIRNAKTVDPADPRSTPVLQIETAMGAAIESFERSGAIVVPRSRFAPVKNTADLLALRSDAYQVTADHRIALAESRQGRPPVVHLDPAHYRILAELEALFPEGPPSLIGCDSLKVTGPVRFSRGVICQGAVEFVNTGGEPGTVAPGTYRDQVVRLG